MSTSSSDETVKLKFPSAITGPSGRRDKRCNAAWFIEQAYQLNPQKNIVEKKAAVEEGWKMLARANFPLSVQGMMAEMRTPRVQRLWADLCINYALYVNLDSTYRLPLRRVVGWPIGEKEKIAVLYGLPGAVIWIPFYGDWPLDQVLYSNIANGIQQLNPHLPTTPQIVDCILSHVLKNEYREEPEEAIPSRLENQLRYGLDIYWKLRSVSPPSSEEVEFKNILTIPSRCATYADFNTACHYLHPNASVSREQVYESFRWLFSNTTNLKGKSLVEAIGAALPSNLEQYHNAVDKFSTAMTSHFRETGVAHQMNSGRPSFPIAYNCHRMLSVDTFDRVLPVVRIPLPTPKLGWKPKDQLLADFSYQYHLLNPGLNRHDRETVAWNAMLVATNEGIQQSTSTPNDAEDGHGGPQTTEGETAQETGQRHQGSEQDPAGNGAKSRRVEEDPRDLTDEEHLKIFKRKWPPEEDDDDDYVMGNRCGSMLGKRKKGVEKDPDNGAESVRVKQEPKSPTAKEHLETIKRTWQTAEENEDEDKDEDEDVEYSTWPTP